MLKRLIFGAAVALVAGTVAAQAQEGAASKAVEAAKQYSGTTITVVAEAGLQALLDKQHTGPEWEQLTGIKVKVVEIPFEEIYPKTILEHFAGNPSYRPTFRSKWYLSLMGALACFIMMFQFRSLSTPGGR